MIQCSVNVVIDEKIVGAVAMQIWKKAKYFYIDVIVIDSDYKRKGVGTKLMEYVEGLSKEQGADLIWFFSEEKDLPMHKLSEKLNYVRGKKFQFFSKELK